MKWQPIETYWNDESDKTKPILVYFPNYGVQQVSCEFTGLHIFKFDGRAVMGLEPEWLDRKKAPTSPPTHWMPLPPPPQGDE